MKFFSLPAALCLLSLLAARPVRAQIPNQGLSDQTHMPAASIATGGPAAAQAAADVWLGLVDDGQYVQAWQKTASIFQHAVSQDSWTSTATTRRMPLGKMLTRKLVSATFSKALPGTPEGSYVVATYEASFEHKKTATETVTAALDTDGQWKVSGYYVR